jgi:hypothetical protein
VVAPVAAVGVDAVFAEDFAGVCVDHGDGGGVDQDGDRRTCVGGADAEVVHAAGAAEADLAEAVEVVVVDAVVRPAVLSGWGGLDGGGIGLGRGGAMERTMGQDLVVDAGEGVQLGLQLGHGGGGGGLRGEPALQGLVEAFDLALGLGMAGMAWCALKRSSIAFAPRLSTGRNSLRYTFCVVRVFAWPTRCAMSLIGMPALDGSETKLCRSSRGVHSSARSPACSATWRKARRTLAASRGCKVAS